MPFMNESGLCTGYPPDTPADVRIADGEVLVSFHRHAHLPIIMASGLLDSPLKVPWWDGLSLRMTAQAPS